jgi:hypothetical protein
MQRILLAASVKSHCIGMTRPNMCIIVAQKTFLLRGVNKLLTVDVAEPTAHTIVIDSIISL